MTPGRGTVANPRGVYWAQLFAESVSAAGQKVHELFFVVVVLFIFFF